MISLWTAATGMESMKFKIEVIANNLSNTNTDGFKKTGVDFNDLLYQYKKLPMQQDNPTGTSVGLGARVAGTTIEHSQGSLKITDVQTDWAIDGRGFFELTDPITGVMSYTRNGSFKLDDQGRLVSVNGYLLNPQITIPPNLRFSHIGEDGRVYTSDTVTGEIQIAGQINIGLFPNTAGLQAIGNSMYRPTLASGAAILTTPRQAGSGRIVGGALESSNVQIVHEMVDLITTQKAFDTNSKVITVSDKMMDTANNLTR